MLRLVTGLVVVALMALAGCSPPRVLDTPDDNAYYGRPHLRLMSHRGEVWVLTDEGISRLRQGATMRDRFTLPEPVREMCVYDNAVMVVTSTEIQSPNRKFHRFDGEGWTHVRTVVSDTSVLRAMDCTLGTITLLTSDSITEIKPEAVKAVNLLKTLRNQIGVVRLHKTPHHLYAGLDGGEFGTGLFVIERQTGKLGPMATDDGWDMCTGRLSECNNIKGLSTIPWAPECVGVAASTFHGWSSGAVLELCGSNARLLYEETLESSYPPDIPPDTLAMIAIAASKDRLVALSATHVYEFRDGKKVAQVPLPTFRVIDGMRMSFDYPGFVMVKDGIGPDHDHPPLRDDRPPYAEIEMVAFDPAP